MNIHLTVQEVDASFFTPRNQVGHPRFDRMSSIIHIDSCATSEIV